MQTLGLANEQQPSDGMFKRLFWPTIENQYDVDLVGQQGFWICISVAVFSVLVLAVTGQLFLAILVGATYFLAGVGVRERSIAAASLIFSCFLIDKLASITMAATGVPGSGLGNPFVGLVVLMLLAANVRATILSKRWATADNSTENEMPERSTTSLADRFANRMPVALWPKGRYAFYPLATLLLVLTVAGTALMLKSHKTPPATVDNTQQLQVVPH